MTEWKQWRNCSRPIYLERLALADRWFNPKTRFPGVLGEQLDRLSSPHRLYCLGVKYPLRGMADGRAISPVMWLQVLRAHMRGHLALSWLLPDSVRPKVKMGFAYEEARWRGGAEIGRFGPLMFDGTDFDRLNAMPGKVRLTLAEERAETFAIAEQGNLLARLMTESPLVFEGMIVPVTADTKEKM